MSEADHLDSTLDAYDPSEEQEQPCVRERDGAMRDPDEDGWTCVNDHTGCVWNNGHNGCAAPGESLTPLSDNVCPGCEEPFELTSDTAYQPTPADLVWCSTECHEENTR